MTLLVWLWEPKEGGQGEEDSGIPEEVEADPADTQVGAHPQPSRPHISAH